MNELLNHASDNKSDCHDKKNNLFLKFQILLDWRQHITIAFSNKCPNNETAALNR